MKKKKMVKMEVMENDNREEGNDGGDGRKRYRETTEVETTEVMKGRKMVMMEINGDR